MEKLIKQDGFTLIETLAAMVILTIGILGFFTLHARMINTTFRANCMTLASAAVAGQIESIRQNSYSGLVSSTGATEITDPQTGYTVRWTVTNDTPVPDAKFVVVTVVVPNGGPTVSYDYVRHNDGT